ncbi:MAG: OmpA family protein [Phycisphaerales bacterium]
MRQPQTSRIPAKTLLTAAAVSVIGLTLGGCVGQDQFDTTTTMVDSLEAQNARLLQEKQTAESIASRRAERIGELESAVAAKDRQIGQLSGRLDSLTRNMSDLEGRLGNVSMGPALDAQTDMALRQLASRYPDLLQYDDQKGMIRVASDLTFNSGSDSLREGAQEGIRQLARALSGSSASGYALRVVGHTDSQAISNPATRQRFGNNRVLSVYRAIAVSDALQAAGFPANRIEVAGWGPHRPAVANNPTGGTAGNRRVEIFVVPMTDAPAGSSARDTEGSGQRGEVIPQRPAPASQQDFPIK